MKKFFNIALVIFVALIIFSAEILTASAEGVWRLDGTDEKVMPRNFRTMIDAWRVEMTIDDGTHEGLEKLHASASGQPSRGGISLLYEELSTIAPENAEIYLLDLRQESHGFADNLPVSFYVEKNRGNFYIGSDEVEGREIQQLKELQGKLPEFVPLGNADKKIFTAKKFAPKKTYTEREVAEKVGFKYVRFTATDMIFPAPDVVDKFLDFVKNLPENSWLHFHCQAGNGRTTTFLVFYDILKNPELSLEEICKRQYYLGGSNLLKKSTGTDFYADAQNSRADLIKLFYKYVHENNGETWTDFYLKNM